MVQFPTRATNLSWLIFLNAVLASTTWGQSFQAEADELVGSYAKRGEFRGAVLVARNGQVLFERGYGDAVEAWGIANTTNTKFELASLTKQFTGAAILLLA